MFAGPFDLAAAEAVAAGDQDATDTDRLLGDLVERSMVTVEAGPFGRRFRLLETLRQFAAEQLAAHGDQAAVAGRYARWCRDEVAQVGRLLAGHGEVEGVARLAELWPHLRAAVDWACTNGDADLADALVRPIAVEVDLRQRAEIGDWAERILDLTSPQDEARAVFWLLWAGHRHGRAGDHAAYEALVARHGHRDHPLVRFTDAYLSDVGEDMHTWAPAAVAWLREHGEHHAAGLIEVSGVASSLMTLQRFAELEARAAEMAELTDGCTAHRRCGTSRWACRATRPSTRASRRRPSGSSPTPSRSSSPPGPTASSRPSKRAWRSSRGTGRVPTGRSAPTSTTCSTATPPTSPAWSPSSSSR